MAREFGDFDNQSREQRNYDRDYGRGYEGREYEDREPRRGAGNYGGYQGESERDYGQGSQNERAPLEWDDRRYGRDFNEGEREGGRNVYASRESYRRGSGQSQPYEPRGRFAERGGFGRGGRSNFGSSRYGGSDYESNDYGRNESRYSGPYSESSRQYGGQHSDRERNEVVGSNWERTRGGGDWNSTPISNDYDQGYARAYGMGSQSSSQRSDLYGQDSDLYGAQQQQQGPYAQYSQYGSQYGSQGQSSGGYRSQDHRGKGPKGYERSDERLKEIICEALTEAPHIDASDISIDVKNRQVTLTGTVNDRRAKYAAEELIERRAGIQDIRNELCVKNAGESREGSIQSSSPQGQSQQGQSSSSMSAAQNTYGTSGQSGITGSQSKESQNKESGGKSASDKSSKLS